MPNKIDNVFDKIETELAELVPDTLTAVKREVVNPLKVLEPPLVGLVVSRLSREDDTWTAEGLLMLAANKGNVSMDQAVTELVAALDDKIVELIDKGTAGGAIDRPVWDFWYSAASPDMPLMHVGAIGSIRVRTEDPLIVT